MKITVEVEFNELIFDVIVIADMVRTAIKAAKEELQSGLDEVRDEKRPSWTRIATKNPLELHGINFRYNVAITR